MSYDNDTKYYSIAYEYGRRGENCLPFPGVMASSGYAMGLQEFHRNKALKEQERLEQERLEKEEKEGKKKKKNHCSNHVDIVILMNVNGVVIETVIIDQ